MQCRELSYWAGQETPESKVQVSTVKCIEEIYRAMQDSTIGYSTVQCSTVFSVGDHIQGSSSLRQKEESVHCDVATLYHTVYTVNCVQTM